jgi:hypothetical protein
MSFLLAGKPRRRTKIPMQSSGPTRVRGSIKDPANVNGTGGQIQIQRFPREQKNIEVKSITKHDILMNQNDKDHQKAIQAAGISMEQSKSLKFALRNLSRKIDSYHQFNYLLIHEISLMLLFTFSNGGLKGFGGTATRVATKTRQYENFEKK